LGELGEVACLCVGEVKCLGAEFGRKVISCQICKRTLKRIVEKREKEKNTKP